MGTRPGRQQVDDMSIEAAVQPRLGLVEATERLYRTLFATALTFATLACIWGIALAPLSEYNDHLARSLVIGAVVLGLALGALHARDRLFVRMRARPDTVLLLAVLSMLVLWADGGWRSSFYLASYSAIAVAGVVAGLRWALVCAAIAAIGYGAGLVLWGYSLDELRDLKDADTAVANFGGYFLAAFLISVPINGLGSYVIRINQLLDAPALPGDGARPLDEADGDSRPSRATDRLSVREAEIVHLVAAGLTNHEIAERLVVSPRTVQNHVANAMRKTGVRNRTELAILAVREGLVAQPRP